MGKCHKGGPRSRDREKYLVADNGKTYSVSTILACEEIGERRCRALIHRNGTVIFSGRAFDRMPAIKFNHCTSKFFNGVVRAVDRDPTADASASGPVKPRRAAYFEKTAVGPLVAAAGVVSADLVEASDPGDDVDAVVVAMPGIVLGKEDEMAGSKGMSNKFSTDRNGEMLLRQVRGYEDETGKILGDDLESWERFAKWANKNTLLAPWTTTGATWRGRVQVARYRFSPEGRLHFEQSGRILTLARKHVTLMGDVWDIIGPTKSIGSSQLQVRKPWCDGALERVADLFGVTVEFLRDGETVASDPEPPKQQELPVPPWQPVACAAKKVEALNMIGQDPRSRWDVKYASDVLDELEQLSHAGKGVNCKALCSYLDHARRRESISDITESILAGTSRG